ncbi:MAG: SusD/RagB family nutrient-binding outer membrane lipoprotein [Bacteroidales bacterium]|nr:SusD/RagB family nutrient-binding outer membrane lipoprotein [Bacteroidales bacterium]
MKKIFTVLALAATLAATSCNDWLDINTNPNYISDADMSLLLPTVQLMTADKVGYDITLYGSFWAQYVTQCSTTNQYYTIMTYDVTNTSFNSPWSYFYSSVLPRIKEIIAKAEEAGNASNYILEAKSMLVYSLYMLTSLYDQVAYTEGYLTETRTPNFDSGQDMQKILIGLCEEIRTMDADAVAADEAMNLTTSSDMVFGGDTEAWFQFVNTLYLKILLRDFSANQSKISSLLAEDDFLAKDAAFDNFLDQADKSNPLYESDRRQLNTTNNIRCCSDVLNVLSASDPRLTYFYDNNPGGVVSGGPYGTSADPTETSRLALYATEPVYFGTVDEAGFLKAEAYARLGNAASAKTAYEAAVAAAFARVGASGAASFIAGDYAFTAGTAEAMVEQIINQKWASNVHGLPWESWFDLNRTGYPTRGTILTDSHGVLSEGYPQRFIYSKNSADYNPNSPTPVDVNVKMWWQK